MDFETRLIETSTHGRFLLRKGAEERLIVGFHGYAENAERHLAELLRIPGIDAWSVAAVQALHLFYNVKTQEVVASWMTKLDRELAIGDNINYVRRVLETLPKPERLVFVGFSQGAAMAYRAASAILCDGLIVHGGDVPPDTKWGAAALSGPTAVHPVSAAESSGASTPRILLGRGTRDDWYTAEKLEKDLSFLQAANASVTTCIYDGAHEWTDEFREAAGTFLQVL